MNVTKSYNNCCNANGVEYDKKITNFYDVNPNQWNNAYGSNYVFYDASWWKRNISDPIKAFGENIAYETKKAVADPKAALKDLAGDIKESKVGQFVDNLAYETNKALKDPKAAFKDLGGDIKGGFYDVARTAYIGLVKINALNFASKLAYYQTKNKSVYNKILDKWTKKFEGKKDVLENAIKEGKDKKPIFGKDGKYDSATGNYHNFVISTSTAILISSAASIIGAFAAYFKEDPASPPTEDPLQDPQFLYSALVGELNMIDLRTDLTAKEKTELKNALTQAYNNGKYTPAVTYDAMIKALGKDPSESESNDNSMWWWIGGGVVVLGGILTVILLSGNKKN